MRKQHIRIGRHEQRFSAYHFGARIRCHGQVRHVRRHAARVFLRAEQTHSMVFEHISGTREAHVRAIFDLRLILPRIVQMAQRRICFHARDAIGHQAHVQLELAQRAFGIGAKRAAYAAACKTKRTKSRLQLLDIFARKIRRAQIQQAFTQFEALVGFAFPMNCLRNHSFVLSIALFHAIDEVIGHRNKQRASIALVDFLKELFLCLIGKRARVIARIIERTSLAHNRDGL